MSKKYSYDIGKNRLLKIAKKVRSAVYRGEG